MLNDVHIIEEVIEYLQEQLPKNMSILLSESEFERGKASQLYDLIDTFERLIINVEGDTNEL